MELQVIATSNSSSRKTLYIGERKLCMLDKIAGLRWYINANTGHYSTFETDLDKAIAFCLEQAYFISRRPNIDYHLANILI